MAMYAGITLLVRVVLRSQDLPRLDEWKRVLAISHALPSRPSACEWLLERVIEPAAQSSAGVDPARTSHIGERHAAASVDVGSGSSEWRGNMWLDSVPSSQPKHPTL